MTLNVNHLLVGNVTTTALAIGTRTLKKCSSSRVKSLRGFRLRREQLPELSLPISSLSASDWNTILRLMSNNQVRVHGVQFGAFGDVPKGIVRIPLNRNQIIEVMRVNAPEAPEEAAVSIPEEASEEAVVAPEEAVVAPEEAVVAPELVEGVEEVPSPEPIPEDAVVEAGVAADPQDSLRDLLLAEDMDALRARGAQFDPPVTARSKADLVDKLIEKGVDPTVNAES